MQNVDFDKFQKNVELRLKPCDENSPFHSPWTPSENSDEFFISMHYWYDKIKNIVKTPKTIEIKVPDDCNLNFLLDQQKPKSFDVFLGNLSDAVKQIGTPCFLRNSFTSNKHNWDMACYLTDIEKLCFHVTNITEFSAIIDCPNDYYYVREIIKTNPIFYAFRSGLPITKEFRLKLENGKVTHIQPYWDSKAIVEPTIENWEEEIKKIFTLTNQEYLFLENETLKIHEALPERDWSVDWLQAENGEWYLTDMALAHRSYWWEPDFDVVV